MATAFSVLKQRVQYFAAQNGTTDAIDGYSFDDFLAVSINRAIERMQRDHLWEALYTQDITSVDTATSTKTITLPSDINFLESVVIEDTTDSYKLDVISKYDLDTDMPYPEGEAVDRPTCLIRRGRLTAELFAIPDAVYDVWIRYYKWAATLSGAADTPDIPHVDDVIEAGAMVEMCKAKELLEPLAFWEQQYQQRLREAIKQDDKRPEYVTRPRPFTGQTPPPGNFWARPAWRG